MYDCNALWLVMSSCVHVCLQMDFSICGGVIELSLSSLSSPTQHGIDRMKHNFTWELQPSFPASFRTSHLALGLFLCVSIASSLDALPTFSFLLFSAWCRKQFIPYPVYPKFPSTFLKISFQLIEANHNPFSVEPICIKICIAISL